MYSPVLFAQPTSGSVPLEHAWLGAWPSWWPSFIPASPALFALAVPGLLRFTCYYYRKAYYRSFVGSPPGCAVTPIPRRGYRGETGLLLFQNLHRYAMYGSLVYLPILTYDALIAFSQRRPVRHRRGQPRHLHQHRAALELLVRLPLVPPRVRRSRRLHVVRQAHDQVQALALLARWFNERHMQIAMFSLFWVAFTDFYIRMVSMGVIHDFNTWD